MIYGYFNGGDPRKFHPDKDMCSQSEIDNHLAACKRFCDAEESGESLPLEPCPSGYSRDKAGSVVHVLVTPYGIGMDFNRSKE
jgi:hypothetical protein